ncbi:MAG: RNA polymerase sigma factor [Mogibacterium sp.]|nr:RNA polymerase sigma factor [Mogibacterium sp.]
MATLQLDENLIIRMASNDGAAFRELYQQTSGVVYGFAMSILRNKHDAEDVMHDAFIRIHASAVTYKPSGNPMAWILTIVRNLCLNRIRAGKVCEELPEYDELAGTSNDSDTMLDRMVLETAMNVLDAEERQIVILHAMTGFKHREIAEILDLPTGTILSKYNRALKKIRKEMESKGVDR